MIESTRFAPSPSGRLHLGHAFAALTAFASAGAGRFLLRIEDLDAARSREEFVAGIYEDLAWLGLSWVEPVLRQSTRSVAYRLALERLAARQLTYPCFCTRAQVAAELARAGQAPHLPLSGALGDEGLPYPGTCRQLGPAERERRIASGESYAIRLDAAAAAVQVGTLHFVESGSDAQGEPSRITVDPQRLGDIVLARKGLPAAYHLAVVIDDAEQGVTLVTRGRDLFAATHVQRLLQALLELPAPRYAHHRLIVDEQGRKLSKRDAAFTLANLRRQGVSAEEVRRRLG